MRRLLRPGGRARAEPPHCAPTASWRRPGGGLEAARVPGGLYGMARHGPTSHIWSAAMPRTAAPTCARPATAPQASAAISSLLAQGQGTPQPINKQTKIISLFWHSENVRPWFGVCWCPLPRLGQLRALEPLVHFTSVLLDSRKAVQPEVHGWCESFIFITSLKNSQTKFQLKIDEKKTTLLSCRVQFIMQALCIKRGLC